MLAAVIQRGSGRVTFGRVTADDIVLATAPSHPEREGKTIAEVAAALGITGEEVAQRIVDEDGGAATVLLRLMSEDDVRTVLAHPTTMIGSDGLPTLRGKPHPRLYGTFPRVLGRYVRELGLLSLTEAIFRMTGLPAQKFRLEGRGVIRRGARGDLVVFDPATIIDTATEEDPHRYPDGIVHVLVNGTFVVRDGAHTGARPGRALRRASSPA
jgi:dihydroorotase/N-acyl-D-amino-acid deacylase